MAAHRRAFLQVQRHLAQKHGVARVADDAGRDKMKTMALAVLEAVEKAGVDQEEANKAWAGYKGTCPDWTDCIALEHKCESGGLASAKCTVLFSLCSICVGTQIGKW